MVVVLATNRTSPYVYEAIDSVRAQDFPDWRLVIVDNGVPDMGPVAEHVGNDPRIEIVVLPPPATLGLARNVGVAGCPAEFITFLDDDDVWPRSRLTLQVESLRTNPEAPASYSGYWHMGPDGRRFGTDWVAVPATADQCLSGEVDTPHGCTLMVRAADFAAVGGFSPEMPIMEDFELILRLLQRGDFACVRPELLLGYRRHDFNMTSTSVENTRIRRSVMESVVVRQIWCAKTAGNTALSGLLAKRLRRYRQREAADAGLAALRTLRHGRVADTAGELSWGLSRAPLACARGVLRRLARGSTPEATTD